MEEIVKDVLSSKPGSATRFYKMYVSELRKHLLMKLPSEADVDEVLQEVFLSAFDSLPLFRGDSSVKTWLFSISRHEVADFYRRRYVRKAVEQTSRLFEGLATEMETPEFVYRKNRIKKRFNKSLSSLNGRYQRALFLKYEMGMSVKEIAERMNLSFKATESLLYRARMAFIEVYEAQLRQNYDE